MLDHPMPKVLLASLLVILSLVGSTIGMSHTVKTMPITGYSTATSVKSPAFMLSLEDFVASVENGDGNTIVGVYVPGVLALPVGQQPQGNAGFVTREADKATQFGLAGQYGTIGLLAHNDLAGTEFYNLAMNQYAIAVYGDGHLEYFQINQIQQYQALSPTSTFSDFVNLNGNHERLSASQLFSRIYGPGNRMVFQTCLERNGDASWGRIFIIAAPATLQVRSVMQQANFLLDFVSFGLAY